MFRSVVLLGATFALGKVHPRWAEVMANSKRWFQQQQEQAETLAQQKALASKFIKLAKTNYRLTVKETGEQNRPFKCSINRLYYRARCMKTERQNRTRQ